MYDLCEINNAAFFFTRMLKNRTYCVQCRLKFKNNPN